MNREVVCFHVLGVPIKDRKTMYSSYTSVQIWIPCLQPQVRQDQFVNPVAVRIKFCTFMWRGLVRCCLHLAHLLRSSPFIFTGILTAWMKIHRCLCYPVQTEHIVDYFPIMKPCRNFNSRFFLSPSSSSFSSATVFCGPWLPKCSASIPDGIWLLPVCVWFQLYLHLIPNPSSIFYVGLLLLSTFIAALVICCVILWFLHGWAG